MININNKIGVNAGKIWNSLNQIGPQSQSALVKKNKLSLTDFHAAVGWLARENKIYKDGILYKLGTTNLTEKIGQSAGTVWKILENKGKLDLSTIVKTTQIKVHDAYSALGWLAREDKIIGNRLKTNSIIVKLK
jgi:hypothetical protein